MAQLLPGHAFGIKGKRLFKRRISPLILVLAALAGLVSGLSAAQSEALRVLEVISGDRFVAEDGSEVRLAYIRAPAPPLEQQGASWGPAEAARLALVQLLDGRDIALAQTPDGKDRYGRSLSRAFLPDGSLLQAALLRAGHARIIALPAEEKWSSELLTAEREARLARRGLWGHPYYRIRPAQPNRLESGRFQLVIGKLVSANRVRSGAYLNFGRHWKSDVTVKLDRRAAEDFESRHQAVESLAGRRILARGWVQNRDGPLIEISDYRFIELLD